MKNLYSFLFYKLYRFAIAQEKTVNVEFGFVGFASIFEILHFIIIFFAIEDIFKYKVELGGQNLFVILFLIIGFSLNYYVFIKSKLIYKINEYHQNKNYKVWKGNIIFFAYIIFLFLIMIIQTMLYQQI